MGISAGTLAASIIFAVIAGAILGWFAKSKVSSSTDTSTEELEGRLKEATEATKQASEEARIAGEARAGMKATAEHLEGRLKELESERDIARNSESLAKQSVADMQREMEVAQAKIDKERESLTEQTELLRQNREELTKSFTVAAQKLYQDQSANFRELSKGEITNLLQPFREQITQLQQGVIEASKERATLQSNIERIALEAHGLTNALRGDQKAQGDWGEMVIETILQNSGLVKDVNYFLQFSAKNEDGGTVFLDVLLKLPDERFMILDSKTSITEYERFMNAETDEERQQHLNGLVGSLKAQIKGLAGKRYDRIKELPTLEAVLMWVPNEGALTQAIKHDRTLVNYAHQSRVIPVTATTLFATIKVVERLWQYEKQNRSVQAIIDRAVKIYNKFAGFTDAMDGIEKSLENATKSYHTAKGRLLEGPGNVVRQLEQIRELGSLDVNAVKGDWSNADGDDTPALPSSDQ